jgi:ADP-ribose pyrophosphatase
VSNQERTKIYRGTVVDLGLETTLLPTGELLSLEIVRHPGGAAILALDEQSRVCLLRQYRHAIGEWIWELPAGVIEGNEQAIATAKRELREEAGLEADEWKPLFSILPTPGFCNEELFLYRARHLRTVGANPNADEQIEIHWKPLNEVLTMAANGQIRDAKTIAALFRATQFKSSLF